MTQTLPAIQTLEHHAALACRLIRAESHWTHYHHWLARPTMQTPPPRSPAKAVVESLEEILIPLRSECCQAEQRATRLAGPWIASACEWIISSSGTAQRRWTPHLIAAGLLPLYRSLATGHWREGFQQCRRRLSEGIILGELIRLLELDELLEFAVNSQVSPHRVLQEKVEIDLTRLDYLISAAGTGYDLGMNDIGSEAIRLLREYRSEGALPNDYRIPEWSEPQTLWVLSNELLSFRSDLVLPRCWIDTPVPWEKITKHWLHLQQLLSFASTENSNNTLEATTSSKQLDAVISKPHDEMRRPLEHGERVVDWVDQAIEQELHNELSNVTETCFQHQLVPKIMIGEISGLEDAAFQNVVKRRVAVCRSDARSVCLSMLSVHPDSEFTSPSPSADVGAGFIRWHLGIVNWLADHPSIKDPVAFVTREGLLIIIVLDKERNEMTTLLRQGLVEVLTGTKDHSGGSLCQVNVPAKFHVGMASTDAPSASFDAQQLVDSAHRCLTAAQRLGKASIKSIEVY